MLPAFTIDMDTGELFASNSSEFASLLNFENTSTVVLTVRLMDGGGNEQGIPLQDEQNYVRCIVCWCGFSFDLHALCRRCTLLM